MKIAYEPHPVSPERKAELRAQGFKIVDAKFRPVELQEVIGADAQAIDPLDHDGDGVKGGSLPDAVHPRRRGRKPKVN
jgi:hypothetical protein